MAALAVGVADRRRDRRLPGGGPRFGAGAVLRPGQAVVVVNISGHGALVESAARLRPGARTELHLCGGGTRASVTGCIERCQIVGLDPVRYHGVVVFDEYLRVGGGSEGSE
ncbi:MAG: hypothetical protein AB7P34_02285 [Vicinamibacterales bacterium]